MAILHADDLGVRHGVNAGVPVLAHSAPID
jgi:hypothetical protein